MYRSSDVTANYFSVISYDSGAGVHSACMNGFAEVIQGHIFPLIIFI